MIALLTRLHDALRLRTSPVIFFGSAAIILAFVHRHDRCSPTP
jgi:choline/glycine/proline betaine transport protein